MLEWHRYDDDDGVRLVGGVEGNLVDLSTFSPDELARRFRVYPAGIVGGAGAANLSVLPQPMAGRHVVEEGAVGFVPRHPFLAGRHYDVLVHRSVTMGDEVGGFDPEDFEHHSIGRPADTGTATTRVLAIQPDVVSLPRNALRLYIHFSAPMSEGFATGHVRVTDAATGETIPDAFLAMEPELWDAGRRRLTVLFDPARIKRGLAPHREVGYPLRTGAPVEVVVDGGFLDGRGRPLVDRHARRYEIGPDRRGPVNPGSWRLEVPSAGSVAPLVVTFDRPLDPALLQRCLTLQGPDGAVAGSASIGPGEGSWRLVPDRPWAPAEHRLQVDPILEDLAGNSVQRVFDRDLAEAGDEPRPAPRCQLPFTPRAGG